EHRRSTALAPPFTVRSSRRPAPTEPAPIPGPGPPVVGPGVDATDPNTGPIRLGPPPISDGRHRRALPVRLARTADVPLSRVPECERAPIGRWLVCSSP